jgi:hypothetical protein
MNRTLYTFSVHCSFDVQYTFKESEVGPDPEGEEGAVQPSEVALRVLDADLLAALHYNYAVDEVQASAEAL